MAAAGRLAQRLDVFDRDMGLLTDRACLLQEELSERVTEETNRQISTLSILLALFLPPTLVTGLFGMNVKGLPSAEDANGFLVVGGLATFSPIVAYAAVLLLGIRSPKG